MQRKFRAWHEKNKEMVYFNPQKKDQYVSAHFYELIHSDGLTMMQFTGMVDSKGNDIYEGDLLDFDEREWGEPFESEVVPSIMEMTGEWPLSGCANDVKQWRTVIGNVHEQADA